VPLWKRRGVPTWLGLDNYENLHPKDFFNQFHRRADEDDQIVASEVPYRIRDRLKSALWEERRTAYHGAMEIYKRLFIDHQAAELERDRLYYLGKMAGAVNDQVRERYLTALASGSSSPATWGCSIKRTPTAQPIAAAFNQTFAPC